MAERERREKILIAEGEKQSKILEAEAAKEATILAAEAEKEAAVKRAEGEAEAIRQVQEATAAGLKMIKDAGVDEKVIRLRSLEAFEKAADGKATKIIVPSDIQNFSGLAGAIAEVVKK